MQHTTTAGSTSFDGSRALLGLLTLAAVSVLSVTPDRAAADAPKSIQAASVAAVEVSRAISSEALVDRAVTKPILELRPSSRGSGGIVERAIDVINNGVRVAQGPANGTLYVYFERHGFGGALCLRYRW
ncbi:MAG: hypothetical protein JRF55_15545 [Deltaproteobacteria bacterium]|nr:hypothetical protein [Deltaproteobacteria bacterium]MBW2377372.1 hypothetical protein [Deltaproteobacteria bacterium]